MPRITIDVSDSNEMTSFPFWMIMDPRRIEEPSVDILASMITGPFFSRDAAQRFLDMKRHWFSKHAVVYCCSGHASDEYRAAFKNATKEASDANPS